MINVVQLWRKAILILAQSAQDSLELAVFTRFFSEINLYLVQNQILFLCKKSVITNYFTPIYIDQLVRTIEQLLNQKNLTYTVKIYTEQQIEYLIKRGYIATPEIKGNICLELQPGESLDTLGSEDYIYQDPNGSTLAQQPNAHNLLVVPHGVNPKIFDLDDLNIEEQEQVQKSNERKESDNQADSLAQSNSQTESNEVATEPSSSQAQSTSTQAEQNLDQSIEQNNLGFKNTIQEQEAQVEQEPSANQSDSQSSNQVVETNLNDLVTTSQTETMTEIDDSSDLANNSFPSTDEQNHNLDSVLEQPHISSEQDNSALNQDMAQVSEQSNPDYQDVGNIASQEQNQGTSENPSLDSTNGTNDISVSSAINASGTQVTEIEQVTNQNIDQSDTQEASVGVGQLTSEADPNSCTQNLAKSDLKVEATANNEANLSEAKEEQLAVANEQPSLDNLGKEDTNVTNVTTENASTNTQAVVEQSNVVDANATVAPMANVNSNANVNANFNANNNAAINANVQASAQNLVDQFKQNESQQNIALNHNQVLAQNQGLSQNQALVQNQGAVNNFAQNTLNQSQQQHFNHQVFNNQNNPSFNGQNNQFYQAQNNGAFNNQNNQTFNGQVNGQGIAFNQNQQIFNNQNAQAFNNQRFNLQNYQAQVFVPGQGQMNDFDNEQDTEDPWDREERERNERALDRGHPFEQGQAFNRKDRSGFDFFNVLLEPQDRKQADYQENGANAQQIQQMQMQQRQQMLNMAQRQNNPAQSMNIANVAPEQMAHMQQNQNDPRLNANVVRPNGMSQQQMMQQNQAYYNRNPQDFEHYRQQGQNNNPNYNGEDPRFYQNRDYRIEQNQNYLRAQNQQQAQFYQAQNRGGDFYPDRPDNFDDNRQNMRSFDPDQNYRDERANNNFQQGSLVNFNEETNQQNFGRLSEQKLYLSSIKRSKDVQRYGEHVRTEQNSDAYTKEMEQDRYLPNNDLDTPNAEKKIKVKTNQPHYGSFQDVLDSTPKARRSRAKKDEVSSKSEHMDSEQSKDLLSRERREHELELRRQKAEQIEHNKRSKQMQENVSKSSAQNQIDLDQILEQDRLKQEAERNSQKPKDKATEESKLLDKDDHDPLANLDKIKQGSTKSRKKEPVLDSLLDAVDSNDNDLLLPLSFESKQDEEKHKKEKSNNPLADTFDLSHNRRLDPEEEQAQINSSKAVFAAFEKKFDDHQESLKKQKKSKTTTKKAQTLGDLLELDNLDLDEPQEKKEEGFDLSTFEPTKIKNNQKKSSSSYRERKYKDVDYSTIFGQKSNGCSPQTIEPKKEERNTQDPILESQRNDEIAQDAILEQFNNASVKELSSLVNKIENNEHHHSDPEISADLQKDEEEQNKFLLAYENNSKSNIAQTAKTNHIELEQDDINSILNNEIPLSVQKELESSLHDDDNLLDSVQDEIKKREKSILNYAVGNSDQSQLPQTFENFVTSKDNSALVATAMALSKNPGQANFNPFYIYGGCGLGKTHLLKAIRDKIKMLHPKLDVKFIRAHDFVQGFLICTTIKNHNTQFYQKAYIDSDVLIVDDIQGMSSGEKTRNAFFEIIASFLDKSNSQLVLASDVPPLQLQEQGFHPRLASRFGAGVCIKVVEPDNVTKYAIILKKCKEFELFLSSEVADLIVQHMGDNVRNLEGLLKDLKLKSNSLGHSISVEVAKEVIKSRALTATETLDVDTIKEKAAEAFGISKDEIDSSSRKKNVSQARALAMFCAKELLTEKSLTDLAREFKKDHSSVHEAIKKIGAKIQTDEQIKQKYNKLIESFNKIPKP